MCSSSPPPAPDYTAAANATAAGNLDAARAAAAANRVNQVTPYGSLTYTQQPGGGATFNQSAYDAAMQKYNTDLANFKNAKVNTVEGGGTFNGVRPTAPNQADFMTAGNPDGGWTATQTLSPDQQALLDKQNQASLGLADTMNQGVSYVQNMMNSPFDQSALPRQMVNADQTGQDAIMARLNPQITQDRSALENRLANQGITMGSEAWQNAMRQQGNQENDLRSQAALQGINIGNQARQQAIQEQSFFRNEPINTLNAVRTGAQVQNPTFTNVPQQATTQGPDLLGATNMQYGNQLANYNAKQAGNANLMNGLFGIGSAMFL